MYYFIAYILAILLVNVGIAYTPMIETPIGMANPIFLVVGAIFVLRDYAQRAIGHRVLLGMIIGAFLSYIFADPMIAIASIVAFTTSELTDWGLYTITNKPFYQRVWISSLLSVPVDTGVFLYMIDAMTLGTFLITVASKLVAAAVIWYVGYRREKRDNTEAASN